MEKINVYLEDKNGLYSKIIFDFDCGEIVVKSDESIKAIDYHFYGLQNNIVCLQDKTPIEKVKKAECLKKIYSALLGNAQRLNLSDVLISFDENGWWCNRPIWKMKIQYQFLLKKE